MTCSCAGDVCDEDAVCLGTLLGIVQVCQVEHYCILGVCPQPLQPQTGIAVLLVSLNRQDGSEHAG